MSKTKQKYIKTPEQMRDLFEQYVEDRKNSTDYSTSHFSHKQQKQIEVTVKPPLTIASFKKWLRDNDHIKNLQPYMENRDGNYSDFVQVMADIKEEIVDDKMTGGYLGIYQQNLVARDLGLADKKHTDTAPVFVTHDVSNYKNKNTGSGPDDQEQHSGKA